MARGPTPDLMMTLSSFIPMDRRQALAHGHTLPLRTTGAAVLTDLSGYTALTDAFVAALGPQAGGEAFFRALAPLFATQIATIHAYRGSVLSFNGDGLTCWFAGDAGRRAAAAAYALQAAVAALPALRRPDGTRQALGIKVVVAAGPAHRFLVGDPALGLIDTLGGAPLTRLGIGEQLAERGEVLLDAASATALGAAGVWRRDAAGGAAFLVPPVPPPGLPAPTPWPVLSPAALTEAQLRPWVPPVLWDRLRADPTFLIELRPAVALFLRFAGLNYRHAAAPARLDTYIRHVQAVFARSGGTLLSLTVGEKGSYCYASFGAPLAHEDNAARAVAAAWALRTPPAACPEIRSVQIGLASGAVYAGPYGSAAAQAYGARGDSVNLAARLMMAAQPGQILATQEVQRQAGAGGTWGRSLPLYVKGKAAPVAVAALLGDRAPRRLRAPAAPGLVGRDREQAALGAAVARAAGGQGQVVGLVGEAGLGKSRLVAATVAAARTAGWAVYAGAAQSTGSQTPYLAWHAVWQAFFALDSRSRGAAPAGRVAAQLTDLDPSFLPRLPLLGPLLGLALPDTPLTAGLAPPRRNEALEALLLACLRARSRRGAVALVLEDAHWLDPASQDLLHAVGRAIPNLPVLLLVSARPPDAASGPLARLETLPHYTGLTLGPLAPADAAALATTALAATGRAAPPAVAAALAARAEGNPFYLEELVAYIAEQGGDPADAAALARISWPASLQSLLLARIDRTSADQRMLLKVASIVGRRFPVAQLWGVYPTLGPPEAVAADLAALATLGLTPLESVEPEWVHSFRHAITHEVTYESLPAATRAALHGQFAAWLEGQAAATGTPPPLDRLAYHYSRSADDGKAREYLRRAGDTAAAAGAVAGAVGYYTALLARLGDADPERGPLLVALGDQEERASAWEAAATHYQAAQAAGITGAARAAAAQGLGVVCRERGQYSAARTWLEQAQAEYAALGNGEGEARALADLGRVYWLQGHYAPARAVLEASRARAQAAGAGPVLALALHTLGILAKVQGAYPTARTLYHASLALRQELGDRAGMADTLTNLGRVAYDQGDYPAARTLFEDALALDQELGYDRAGTARILSSLGMVDQEQGHHAQAAAHYTESLALRRDLGDRAGIALALTHLGVLAYVQGDYEAARARHTESLGLQCAVGNQAGIAQALTHLGLVAWATGQPTQARQWIGESLGRVRALGPGAPTRQALVAAAAVLPTAAIRASLLGAIRRILTDQHAVLDTLSQGIYDQVGRAVAADLGPAGAARAVTAGEGWDWAAALTLAETELRALESDPVPGVNTHEEEDS